MSGDVSLPAGPRVLLNLVRLLPSEKGAGGAGRLALALLAHLPHRVQLRVVIPTHWRNLINVFPNITFDVVSDDSNSSLRRLLDWCDCYIDPLNGLRPATIDPRVAVISFVLDLQHLRMPWLFTEKEMSGRIAEYGYAIDRSDWLVAISDYERNNFADFYGVDRVSVVHLAGFMAEDCGLTGDEIRQRRSLGEQKPPYLIYPAVPWLHKNHEILIQAIAILRRRGLDVPLVLTNTSGRSAEKERLGLAAVTMGVEDLIDLRGFLDESSLFSLVIESRGMVFPSLYEGFGIPLVDAMALGVPILANPVAAVPEICGNAAAYMSNASNALTLADDIAAFWGDGGTRSQLAERGLVRANDFSSKKMVASLAEAIEAALAAKLKHPLPKPAQFNQPRYVQLAVFVAYTGLTEVDLAVLRAFEDIRELHARAFGVAADVTVGIDISLINDPELCRVFRSAAKLICFDGHSRASFDAAVADFSGRYDQAEFQLVTKFRDGRLGNYDAESVQAAVMAMGLFAGADCAEPDVHIEDCIQKDALDEAEGVLEYHRRRHNGLAVSDVLLRRISARGNRNGTAAFLSDFCTRYARLRVPIRKRRG
ncbi:hypothetical protein CCS92_03205 [Methylobacterium radiotolerans]|jgi:glycosyltransferase involved in cell wall biosynthesis|nr:hypothetical protein CCS92_03205 [Methylobacterium radiotolerans]